MTNVYKITISDEELQQLREQQQASSELAKQLLAANDEQIDDALLSLLEAAEDCGVLGSHSANAAIGALALHFGVDRIGALIREHEDGAETGAIP